MKIFLFNPEDGVYQGEDFADEPMAMRTKPLLPPGATTVAPPRVESGKILRFNMAEGRWDVCTVSGGELYPALGGISEGPAGDAGGRFGMRMAAGQS